MFASWRAAGFSLVSWLETRLFRLKTTLIGSTTVLRALGMQVYRWSRAEMRRAYAIAHPHRPVPTYEI